MSLHDWSHYKLELYDKDRVQVAEHLDVAKGLRWKKGVYGAGEFSFSLPLSHWQAQAIAHEALHFCRIWRDDDTESLMDGIIFKPSWTRANNPDQYLEIAGVSLDHIAKWRSGVPLNPGTSTVAPLTITDHVDDAFKWIVARTLGASAPTIPSGSSRAVPDITIEADAHAYPTEETVTFITRPKYTLYDFLREMGGHYGVDWSFTFDSSMNIVFKTFYPRRGTNKTELNGSVAPIIMNDAGENLRGWRFFWDAGEHANVVIARNCREEYEDAAAVADWWRREIISESSDDTVNAAALTDAAVKIGYAQDFRESVDCQFRAGGSGVRFDVGDQVTTSNNQEAYGPKDETIAEVLGQILDDGTEELGIVFGDPEPDMLDRQSGGGAVSADDPYEDLSDEDSLPVANTADPGTEEKFSREDHVHDLNLTANDAGVMALTDGVGYIVGVNGIATSIVDGELTIDGSGAASSLWTRFDAGSLDLDYALRPTKYGDDVRLKADADADVIWLEGDSGKSHFADDMYLGDAAGVADSRLHIKDVAEGRYGARITFENASAEKGQVGLSDDGELFMNTHEAQGISLQVQSVQKFYLFDDGSQAAFENGGLVAGYVDLSSTGGVANDPMWSLSNETGDLYLDEDATTHIGGYLYTWPLTGAAANKALGVSSIEGASVTLGWLDVGATDHGALTGLGDDDHSQYLLAAGSRALTGHWNAGAFNITASRFYTQTADYLYSVSAGEIHVKGANYAVLYGSTGYLVVGAAAVYPKDGLDLGISGTNDFADGFFTGTVYANNFQVATDCYVGSHAATYLNLYASGFVSFNIGGTFLAFVGNQDSANALFPASGVSFDIGTTSRKIRSIQMSGTITIGGDVNLYRGGADVLQTDDGLTIGGNLLYYGDGAANRSLAAHRHGNRTGSWTVYGARLSWLPVYGTDYVTVIGYLESYAHYHSITTSYGTP